MIIALAYSSKDVDQAARLVRWIQFLSAKDSDSMRQASLLLVPARPAAMMRRHPDVVRVATNTFGTVRCYVPDRIDERGWPASANFMFRETLEHVEQHFRDDLLWLEPDAAPLVPDWFRQLSAAWDARPAGKVFMGQYVPGSQPHLTGIAIYGKGWREKAPALALADEIAWDVFAAKQVLPRAVFTPLIQHIFHNPKPRMEMLKPAAVIFHQNKDGELIRLLDQTRHQGELYQGRPDIITRYETMKTFFTCANATKAIRASGIEFEFERVDHFAGAWRGIYAAEREDEIVLLRSLPINMGVTEIPEAEYIRLAKKKAPSLTRSMPLNAKPQAAPIQHLEKGKSAVVVEGAPARPPESIPQSPAVVPENWEAVVEIGPVAPPNTLAPAKTGPARARKKKEPEG